MSEPPSELRQMQAWLQAVITHPAGIESGIESAEAQASLSVGVREVESVITRSKALTSVERLAVYGNAYFARLLECMGELFPALRHALGEELFDQFALHYLQDYPSGSYTLGRLADRFAQFLDESKPSDVDPETAWPDFLVDLARLERSIDQVFDGPGPEGQTPLSAERLAAIPTDRWEEARLVPSPALRLLEFKFPVNDYYTAYRAGEQPSLPPPGTTYLALSRRDYIVSRLPLSRAQYVLLSALLAEESLGDAVAACAAEHQNLEALGQDLRQWFEQWAAEELFLGVQA